MRKPYGFLWDWCNGRIVLREGVLLRCERRQRRQEADTLRQLISQLGERALGSLQVWCRARFHLAAFCVFPGVALCIHCPRCS